MLCARIGWNWSSDSGEEDFLILSMLFHYFIIISPWKRAGPFIWTNLNSLHPKMRCAKFGWNWSSGSVEEYENVKSLPHRRQRRQRLRQRQRRWTTHKLWSETFTLAFGSGELKRIQNLNTSIYFLKNDYMQRIVQKWWFSIFNFKVPDSKPRRRIYRKK